MVSSVPDLTGEWTSPTRRTSVPSNGEYKSRSSPAVSVVRGPLVLWGVVLIHDPGRKGEKLLGVTPRCSRRVCVLGLPCDVKKFDSSSTSHGLGLLNTSAT